MQQLIQNNSKIVNLNVLGCILELRSHFICYVSGINGTFSLHLQKHEEQRNREEKLTVKASFLMAVYNVSMFSELIGISLAVISNKKPGIATHLNVVFFL